MQRLARWYLELRGWTIVGERPTEPRLVVAAAHHTCNFDFLVFLAVVSHFRMRAAYIGKHTLFRWPFGGLMRRLGGIPVHRDSGQGIVEQVAEAIRSSEEIAVIIAVEGTRKRADHWRSGFYHIAEAAGVPIQLAFVDYPGRRTGLGPIVYPSGDVGADMDLIREFYAIAHGRHPELESPIRLREEG
ncbi:MAG: 1-acyl-sn-glycerol-3-phosphate acyltransferase [Acidimicrobiia bacterium]